MMSACHRRTDEIGPAGEHLAELDEDDARLLERRTEPRCAPLTTVARTHMGTQIVVDRAGAARRWSRAPSSRTRSAREVRVGRTVDGRP